mmetsp:Transcript_10980/g.24188  ORF Transcript_10980/g.24188 Transcript_10980/m.24188 type:complete len:777 (-) Transcript_10980:138-2468(-)
MVKKALCIGLNYPQRNPRLYGSVNDCLDWEHVLRNMYNFETRVLIDQNPDGSIVEAETQIPTHYNIITQIGGWLCKDVTAGDVLTIVFAGAGLQARSPNGALHEALVPADYEEMETGPLVYDDELHALFSKLPAGCLLTMILDCCSGDHMLDVPCSLDTTDSSFRTLTVLAKPREAANRTAQEWERGRIKHAQARPRFYPNIDLPQNRNRRTPENCGAHAGRMTLNPGVTAFCFAATRTPDELAMDANIKKHQCGVLSFCLMEALQSLKYSCTYETLLKKAVEKLEDVRSKYMTTMEQHFMLSYCPNAGPNQVCVFDEKYSTMAHYSALQTQERMGDQGHAPRMPSFLGHSPQQQQHSQLTQASSDFVPAPQYQQEQSTGNHLADARLFLITHAADQLGGLVNGPCDPYIATQVGQERYRTSTQMDSVSPMWEKDNQFTFPVRDPNVPLLLEVINSASNQILGRAVLDLKTLPSAQWERRREALQDLSGQPTHAAVTFDVRLESSAAKNGGAGGGIGGDYWNQAPSPHDTQRSLPNSSFEPQRLAETSPVRYNVPVSPVRQELDIFANNGFQPGLPRPNLLGQEPRTTQFPDLFGTPNLLGNMPDLLTGGNFSEIARPAAPSMLPQPSLTGPPSASYAAPVGSQPMSYTGYTMPSSYTGPAAFTSSASYTPSYTPAYTSPPPTTSYVMPPLGAQEKARPVPSSYLNTPAGSGPLQAPYQTSSYIVPAVSAQPVSYSGYAMPTSYAGSGQPVYATPTQGTSYVVPTGIYSQTVHGVQ